MSQAMSMKIVKKKKKEDVKKKTSWGVKKALPLSNRIIPFLTNMTLLEIPT